MQRALVRCAVLGAAVILGACILWIGYRVWEYRSDSRLVDELAATESNYGYDGASWGAPELERLDFHQDSVLFRPGVWGVAHPVFSRVDSISFRGIVDADLERCSKVLQGFSRSIEVCIVSDEISDIGLAALAQVKNLNGVALYSPRARITDAGVARLSALPLLETLTLDSITLTDRCLVSIARFPRLRHVTLCQIPVSVSGLEAIVRMKTLETLDLRSAEVDENVTERITLLKHTHPELEIVY